MASSFYSPRELAGMMQAEVHGIDPEEKNISVLLTDSRRVTFARSAVFFALKTLKNDGHKYIGELINKEVSCFVVSALPKNRNWLQKATFLLVADTLDAMQKVTAAHRNHFNYPVVAITGSNGKTIVKEWLSQLLAPQLKIVKNPRSYNSQTGVPISVWNMNATHELAIFEAGISQPGEMKKLQGIIQPDTGIFTNIGPAHNEGFFSIESKIDEKLQLFYGCSLLICSSEQDQLFGHIRKWAQKHPDTHIFSWGTQEGDQLKKVSMMPSGDACHLEVEYKSNYYAFRIPFTDQASIENLMHCLAFIFAHDLYQPELHDRVMKLGHLSMRMEMKQAINNCIMVDDAYSSDLLSLGIAMDFLSARCGNRKKVFILSDIAQSGLKPDELYKNVAALVREKGAHRVIAIGAELSAHRELFSNTRISVYRTTEEFLHDFDAAGFQDMGILIKGAREFGLERISQKLQQKDHQTRLEINLDALVYNLNVYRSALSPETRIMGMVKAFSYGSGSFEIASILQFHGVDYLAVAFADEGVELREAGITMPVVVLNPELHNLDILIRYGLEPEIYSVRLLQRMLHTLAQSNRTEATDPSNIHIKLDTGMHRLGFTPDQIPLLCQMLKDNSAVRVASVFSHLSASDMSEFDDFTAQQLNAFRQMTQELEQALGYGFLKHIANSAAVSRFPDAHFDMVRLGIGLYGYDPSKAVQRKLRNVTTFKSVISQIRTLAAGESVGYNRGVTLQKETRMAIVPVGYADGLDRRLGNGRSFMIVNGQKAYTLGVISMDMCSLDVTGLNAEEGDEVIIFGEEIPVAGMAQNLGTIPYEIYTSIPPRVRRIYFSE
jgi:Alr-MurF fusion protein